MSDKAEQMEMDEIDPSINDAQQGAPDASSQAEGDGVKPNFSADASSGLPSEEIDRLTADIVAALKTVYDPEIPVDIYELGLIYRVEIDDERKVKVDMTLTAPGCPVAGEMPGWVEYAIGSVEGVREVEVNMVFDPPWSPERMSEEAQVALNWW